jgi:tRNA pseudouridine38-40 synthase
MRVALGLEYDGSRFCGWQTQPARCSIQDALEAALGHVAAESVGVTAAGRTDTGVHATHQVVHFDTSAQRPASAWIRGTNSGLPEAVSVLWAKEVSPEFHARFSALGRSYRYVLLNRSVRPGLMTGRAGWFHHHLDEHAMAEAAAHLIGEHDFSAFRAAECQARSPVRRLFKLEVRRVGEWIIFDLHANAFLHHMVRNIVGCLVYVGKGKYPAAWLAELLAKGDRTHAAPTFPSDGLYFAGAAYDPKWSIPAASGPTLSLPPLDSLSGASS